MTNVVIRLVKKDEFEELMKVMNTAFNFVSEEEKFEHILPKLYFKDNKNMIHYGAFVDGKLVASIGLYTMEFVSKYSKLKVGCVGAVSTHPDYRKNGFFSLLIKKIVAYAKRRKFDLMFLGGNRFRYGNYGFENAGRRLMVTISNRTAIRLSSNSFELEKLDRNNIDGIRCCLNIYNKELQHVNRTLDNFYNHIITWNCVPYIVKVDNKIVGYFSISDNNFVNEICYIKKYEDTIFKACLDLNEEVRIQIPYSSYSNKLLTKVDGYSVEHNEMYYIINYDSVKKYLGFDESKKIEFNKLSKREKVRSLLGCNEYSTKYCKLDMYISRCDQG